MFSDKKANLLVFYYVKQNSLTRSLKNNFQNIRKINYSKIKINKEDVEDVLISSNVE